MAAEEPSNAELVARIVAGRSGPDARDAERALCARFLPQARLYGLRHLRDEARAQDLAQTALVALIEAARAGRIEDAENVHRFVLGICRNSMLRMRKIDGRATPSTLEELEHLPDDSRTDTERVDLGRLWVCFDELDPRAKTVVRESFQEGRSAQEIAERLTLSAVNVRVVRHRAVAALRRCLDRGAREAAS